MGFGFTHFGDVTAFVWSFDGLKIWLNLLNRANMSIEFLQKVADFLLKGVAATVIAAGGLYVSLNKNRLDQSSTCMSMSEKLYVPANENTSLEIRQQRMSLLIDRYNESCKPLSSNEVDFLINSLESSVIKVVAVPDEPPFIAKSSSQQFKLPSFGVGDDDVAMATNEKPRINQTPPLMVDDTPKPAAPGLSGWIVVGRVAGSYGQINFDGSEELLKLPLPAVKNKLLKARWAVNLRENTTNTRLGKNPIVSTLEAGDCIRSGELVEVRGQIWTSGEIANCE